VVVTALIGVAAAVAVGAATRWSLAPATGWIVGAGLWVAWNLAVILPMDDRTTAAHATREDPSRRVAHTMIVCASVASLISVGVLLAHGDAKQASQDVDDALAVLSVATAWLLVHTVFTLRYARLYYSGPDGGIDFNQQAPPRYMDFAYLGFTIGMTYQVSDTTLQTTELRSSALAHALLSFLFGAIVLGTTVNLVAGLAG
jgi:uncharacterized membrane protein